MLQPSSAQSICTALEGSVVPLTSATALTTASSDTAAAILVSAVTSGRPSCLVLLDLFLDARISINARLLLPSCSGSRLQPISDSAATAVRRRRQSQHLGLALASLLEACQADEFGTSSACHIKQLATQGSVATLQRPELHLIRVLQGVIQHLQASLEKWLLHLAIILSLHPVECSLCNILVNRKWLGANLLRLLWFWCCFLLHAATGATCSCGVIHTPATQTGCNVKAVV
mmetsp:Transcript_60877/g.108099  ORF Transcript_60877/g.108099 Transcript_60877/m.108099 type:complete len:231 (+) Transcript_60877:148-840(+)